MKKSTSILLMVAGGMVVFGAVLYVAMLVITGGHIGVYYDSNGWHRAQDRWNASIINTEQPRNSGNGTIITEQHEFSGITSLDISSDIGDIELREGGAGSSVNIEYSYHSSWKKPICTGENGTLYFANSSQTHSVINFGMFNFPVSGFNGDFKVVITYPKGMEFSTVTLNCDLGGMDVDQLKVAGDFSAKVDLGDASLSNITAASLSVYNSCGKTDLNTITAKSVSIENDLGAVHCNNITSDRFSSDSDSGKVDVHDSKLGFASLSSDLGAIDATGITTTGLEVDCSSGSVTLQGALAGRTEVDCDLGGMEITTTLPRDQYSLDLSTDLGKVYVDGESRGTEFEHSASAPNSIEADNSSGSVKVNFK